ncbi:MAG: nitroreductase family protein [bacterium]|nr:nitroreductase family protein [bacterium]
MTEFEHKHARPEHPIMDVIAERWSPYNYDPERSVERHKLLSCLEAARWAASSYNEQPWRFIVATKDSPEQFERGLGCLLEANQEWARHAPVLILTAYASKFSRNDKDNRVALHDLGLAVGNLSIEATRQGLHVHQMAGVNLSRVRAVYGIPEDHEPATAIAIGYARAQATSDELAARDSSQRQRNPLSQWVFGDKWGTTSSLL